MTDSFNIIQPWSKEYKDVLAVANSAGYAVPDRGVNNMQWKHNRLFKELKACGFWAKQDAGYVFANTQKNNFARINVINPGVNTGTFVNTVVFDAQGIRSDNISGAFDTTWAPSSGIHFTQDNCSVSFGVFGNHSTSAPSQVPFGTESGGSNVNRLYCILRTAVPTADRMGLGINAPGVGSPGAINTTTTGRWYAERTSSTTSSIENNNASPIFTNNNTSTGRSTRSVYVCALHLSSSATPNSLWNEVPIVYWFAGAALTTTEQADADAIFSTFISSI